MGASIQNNLLQNQRRLFKPARDQELPAIDSGTAQKLLSAGILIKAPLWEAREVNHQLQNPTKKLMCYFFFGISSLWNRVCVYRGPLFFLRYRLDLNILISQGRFWTFLQVVWSETIPLKHLVSPSVLCLIFSF